MGQTNKSDHKGLFNHNRTWYTVLGGRCFSQVISGSLQKENTFENMAIGPAVYISFRNNSLKRTVTDINDTEA